MEECVGHMLPYALAAYILSRPHPVVWASESEVDAAPGRSRPHG